MNFEDLTAAVEWGFYARDRGLTIEQTLLELKSLVKDRPHRFLGDGMFCEACEKPNGDPLHKEHFYD